MIQFATFYLHVSINEELKFLNLTITFGISKAQAQLEVRGNDGSKSGRNYRRCERSVLEIGPYRRTPPQAVGHNVLKLDIVVKS